jgi:RNA polymerase sigma factor (sigma-70 family)
MFSGDFSGDFDENCCSTGATCSRRCRLPFVDTLDTDIDGPGHHRGPPGGDADADAAQAVTALYDAHAVSMIRIALIMLGDRAAAEDVVQDAFFGLYRRWSKLSDRANALAYVRSSVLNGCRDALRRQARRDRRDRAAARSWQDERSAEALALIGEDHRRILAAVRRLPDRQREALLCRFYLDMSEEETARAMRISQGTVKSATSRAVAAIGRMLKEGQW